MTAPRAGLGHIELTVSPTGGAIGSLVGDVELLTLYKLKGGADDDVREEQS